MDVPAAPETPSRLSATLLMGVAAVAAAAIAMFGEEGAFSAATVLGALAGLVPWALVSGGVRLHPAVFAAMGLAAAIPGVVVAANPGSLFPVMLVVVWVARSSGSVALVGAVVAAALGLVAAVAIGVKSAHEGGLIYFAGGIGISWLAGTMLRRQEELTDELRELHELSVEHAASAERTRIAREVHDVVAHSLTVVMLHLTGARRVLATDPARADEALARAEDVGRSSLDSIRQVVSLLRTEADGEHVPLPGVADLTALVDGYRAGGLAIDATIAVDADNVEPSVGLALYRVVQESLTNVLRHAPGASCSVRVATQEGRAVVVVENAAPVGAAPAAGDRVGLGVRGMTERVRALGGTSTVGPTVDGGWRVSASLPLRARAAVATVAIEARSVHQVEEGAWTITPATPR